MIHTHNVATDEYLNDCNYSKYHCNAYIASYVCVTT